MRLARTWGSADSLPLSRSFVPPGDEDRNVEVAKLLYRNPAITVPYSHGIVHMLDHTASPFDALWTVGSIPRTHCPIEIYLLSLL